MDLHILFNLPHCKPRDWVQAYDRPWVISMGSKPCLCTINDCLVNNWVICNCAK